jgi:hypothetical protein
VHLETLFDTCDSDLAADVGGSPPRREKYRGATRYKHDSGIVSYFYFPFYFLLNCCRYHNFFKSHVLKGYRNRRLDYVISLLQTVVKNHYMTKQLRQHIGMNGLDLFTKARKEADKRGKAISSEDIQVSTCGTFHSCLQYHPVSPALVRHKSRTRYLSISSPLTNQS